MSFLKKLGVILLKVGEIATGISPILSSSLPGGSGVIQTVSADLAQIAQIIVEVEAVGQALQLAGPQKLQAATPLVAQIILQSSLLAKHKIANPTLFQGGCQKVADGMVDILNSLHDNTIDTTSKT